MTDEQLTALARKMRNARTNPKAIELIIGEMVKSATHPKYLVRVDAPYIADDVTMSDAENGGGQTPDFDVLVTCDTSTTAKFSNSAFVMHVHTVADRKEG